MRSPSPSKTVIMGPLTVALRADGNHSQPQYIWVEIHRSVSMMMLLSPDSRQVVPKVLHPSSPPRVPSTWTVMRGCRGRGEHHSPTGPDGAPGFNTEDRPLRSGREEAVATGATPPTAPSRATARTEVTRRRDMVPHFPRGLYIPDSTPPTPSAPES